MILLFQHLLREREWSTFRGELPLASSLKIPRLVIRTLEYTHIVYSQDLSIVNIHLVSSLHSHPIIII